MSDALTDYYLQSMGIERWIVRQSSSSHQTDLLSLEREVAACTRCPLNQTRSQTVFARGNPQAKLMIIGEAPGFSEDQQGLPFVGESGALLNQMLRSIGLVEDQVYITNVLKCRPPENREPLSAEISSCGVYLIQQIEQVKPAMILALGSVAGHFLLNNSLSIKELRQTIHHYQSTPLLISYHPAYLLRDSRAKKQSYADLLLLQKLLGMNKG